MLRKTQKAKENFADSHFHNILRLFDGFPNLALTTTETIADL